MKLIITTNLDSNEYMCIFIHRGQNESCKVLRLYHA